MGVGANKSARKASDQINGNQELEVRYVSGTKGESETPLIEQENSLKFAKVIANR